MNPTIGTLLSDIVSENITQSPEVESNQDIVLDENTKNNEGGKDEVDMKVEFVS